MESSRSFSDKRRSETDFLSLAQLSRMRDRNRIRLHWSGSDNFAWKRNSRIMTSYTNRDDVIDARARLKSSSMTRLLSLDTPVAPVVMSQCPDVTRARYETPHDVERILQKCENYDKMSDSSNQLRSPSMSCISFGGHTKSRKRENYVCLSVCSICYRCSVTSSAGVSITLSFMIVCLYVCYTFV